MIIINWDAATYSKKNWDAATKKFNHRIEIELVARELLRNIL